MTRVDVLSGIRIAIALLIAGVMTTSPFPPGTPAAVLLAFLFGVATDIVGRTLARGPETLRGGVLDSLADKALVYGVLLPITLTGFPSLLLLLPLVARDGVAVAMRLAAAQRGTVLRVGRLGRLKTGTLYVACGA